MTTETPMPTGAHDHDLGQRAAASTESTHAGHSGSSELPRKPRHFPCFDGLRAIAAVSVLLL
ncbi:MAG: hypothetical protein ACYDDZ_06830, partial [Acidimicrobiales bacterium]